MSSASNNQVQELEQAILERAKVLAEELERKAQIQRDNILRKSYDQLHFTEERETAFAKAEAERLFRRKVQADALKRQGQLDQLRWQMVQTVQSRLHEKISALREDKEAYRAWLIKMLAEAADAIAEGELSAEACECDLPWLQEQWSEMVAEAAPKRTIHLSSIPTWGSGGLKVRNQDNNIQLDNRFEGRISRMQSQLQQVILERLFPGNNSIVI